MAKSASSGKRQDAGMYDARSGYCIRILIIFSIDSFKSIKFDFFPCQFYVMEIKKAVVPCYYLSIRIDYFNFTLQVKKSEV